jgi:hypothetical protein
MKHPKRTNRIEGPTGEAYGPFQHAYDHYNRQLFEGTLPRCVVTLKKSRAALGHFARREFMRLDDPDTRTDEINLNPNAFKVRSIADVLSTLVHEMAHLWQHHFGKESRSGYHNKQWADHMEALGLMPSSGGLPGGKRTGGRVSHYIIEGGKFATTTQALLASGFALNWCAEAQPPRGGLSGRRVKYHCERCGLNLWAKTHPLLFITCPVCHAPQDGVDTMSVDTTGFVMHIAKRLELEP